MHQNGEPVTVTNQLTPLPTPFEPEVSTALSRYPQGPDGYIIQLFRVFANSKRFLNGKGVVNLLDQDSPLTVREREIVILRTCANNNCEYEWGVHVATFARPARLSAEQVAATRTGSCDASCWDPSEQLLLACVDGWCSQARLSPDLAERFAEQWNRAQQLEIIALVGNYHTISFVANTAQLSLEPGSPSFPG